MTLTRGIGLVHPIDYARLFLHGGSLVGGLSPGASHHSFTTSSEEPPLSSFNSYWDIPSIGFLDITPIKEPKGSPKMRGLPLIESVADGGRERRGRLPTMSRR